MAILVKSDTPEADKNFWATSWEAFSDAENLYGRDFITDVAAEPLTAKCSLWIGNPDLYDQVLDYRTGPDTRHAMLLAGTCIGLDSMIMDWGNHWWCNPPFDYKREFVERAREMQAHGMGGMMLLPYEPLTQWWRNILERDAIVYEPDGRYQFYERDGETQKQGANFGSVLVGFPTFHIRDTPRIPFKRGFRNRRKVR